MPIYTSPSIEEVNNACRKAGYNLSKEEIQYQHEAAIGMIESLNILQECEIETYMEQRNHGEAPKPEQNTHNQWAWKCNIQRTTSGKLANKKVGVKDCVAVAGLPMQMGCAGVMDYIPSYDASCISPLLDEGAIITGKTNCENVCFSALSHTSCNGNVMNPYDKKRTAGGSSSGSGVSVALGDVDMAIGTDTGGSVRIPSNFCGVVGMKTTAGLIPTKGVTPCISSFDTVGVLTKTVKDNALFLDVMATSNKHLQPLLKDTNYGDDIENGIRNMRIALLKEGFELKNSDPEINKIVRNSIQKLIDLGASIEEISIPEAKLGTHVLVANCFHIGYWLEDKFCPRGQKTLRYEIKEAFKNQNELNVYAKLATLLRHYLNEEEADRIYERAEDIADVLKRKYVENLNKYNAICVPTIPVKAPDIPSNDLPLSERFPAMITVASNTTIANITGHPALTVNCGFTEEKMPVGIMFTGKYFDEKTLYRIGSAVEKLQN